MSTLDRRSFGRLLSMVLPASVIPASLAARPSNQKWESSVTLYRLGSSPEPIRIDLIDPIMSKHQLKARIPYVGFGRVLAAYAPPHVHLDENDPRYVRRRYLMQIGARFKEEAQAETAIIRIADRTYSCSRADIFICDGSLFVSNNHDYLRPLSDTHVWVSAAFDNPGIWAKKESFEIRKGRDGIRYAVRERDIFAGEPAEQIAIDQDWPRQFNPVGRLDFY